MLAVLIANKLLFNYPGDVKLDRDENAQHSQTPLHNKSLCYVNVITCTQISNYVKKISDTFKEEKVSKPLKDVVTGLVLPEELPSNRGRSDVIVWRATRKHQERSVLDCGWQQCIASFQKNETSVIYYFVCIREQ